MSVQVVRSSDDCWRISLGGGMTIYEAWETRDALLEVLSRSSQVELDLGEVAEIDTAGVQILVHVKREAVRANKDLRIVSHSAATLEAIERYGLAGFFGDPVLMARE